MEDKLIILQYAPLEVNKALTFVSDDAVGGIDIFVGTVRATTNQRNVVALEFEAYEKMAISELEKIIETARKKWPLHKIAVLHALGRKEIGDKAVVIAVSSAHRNEAFAACRYIIDTLKQTVPIWKKEIFEDGEVWVAAHP